MTRVRPLLVLFTAFALAACGGGETEGIPEADRTAQFSNDRFDLTFRYPDDLQLGVATSVDKSTSGEPVARQVIFADQDNGIVVSRYDLEEAVTDDNLDDVHAEVDDVVAELTGHEVTGRRTTVGGFVAFRYDDLAISVPPDGSSDLAFLFDGTTEYQINCQSTPGSRTRIDAACAMVLDTLEPA